MRILLVLFILSTTVLHAQFEVWKGSASPLESGWTPVVQVPDASPNDVFQSDGASGTFSLTREQALGGAAYFINDLFDFSSPRWTVEISATVESIASPPNFCFLQVNAPVAGSEYGTIRIQVDAEGVIQLLGKPGSSVELGRLPMADIHVRLLGKLDLNNESLVEVLDPDDHLVGVVFPDRSQVGPPLAFGDMSQSKLAYNKFQGDTRVVYHFIAWDPSGAHPFSERKINLK